MKKLLCLLVGVMIFVGAASSAMTVDVDGQVTAFITSANGEFVNIFILKTNGGSEHCWCYPDPDNALLDLVILAFQTQSVCTFTLGGNSGFQLLDIKIFISKSTTNAHIVDEVKNAETDIVNYLSYLQRTINKIYNIVRAIYSRV